MTYPRLTSPDDAEGVPVPRDGRPLLVGRSERAGLRIPDRHCSREQLAVRWTGRGARLEPLSLKVPTRLEGVELTAPADLAHGARIEVGETLLTYLEHAPAGEARGEEFVLRHRGVLGRGSASEYRLDHPQVSRRHALLERRGDAFWIEDLGSSNGTFVEGVRLTAPRRLEPSQRIEVGPWSLVFEGERLVRRAPEGALRLVAQGLRRGLPGGEAAELLLDDVSLVAEPGELLVVLGPSGAGKSTLMGALSARRPADRGRVLLDDLDLYANFEALKHGIAYVPQRELLHPDLTLTEALTATARLRLPGDTPPEELAARVHAALARVDLARQAQVRVGELSGGQRKRAGLASETLAEPHLLLVDEVTSGLDEQADWDMMRLLRRLAERGRTVVCVTHNLSNVEEFAHKVAVLARGGVLAFLGTPGEAREYFEVEHLGEIYGRLARHEGAAWKERFLDHERYLEDLLPALQAVGAQASPSTPPVRARRAGPREVLRQTRILARRYLTLLARDRRVLALALGQALLVGATLLLAFGGSTTPERRPLELFLLAVSCFWLGCSNASKEIVKERDVLAQERDAGLSPSAYLASKVLGLLPLALTQVALLLALVAWRHPGHLLPGLAALLLFAIAAGTTLGLALSARARTPDQATTLVPVVLIPQLVLAGALVPDMPAAATALARTLVSGHWIQHGTSALVDAPDAHLTRAVLVLLLHTVLYLSLARVLLRPERPRA